MDEIKLDTLLTRLGFERTAGRKYIHEGMIMELVERGGKSNA